jgi:oligopeptide transport system permease protein
MFFFTLNRLLQSIPVLVIVITATFFLVRAAPGGPFSAEKNVPPEVTKALEAQYKLDQSIWQQYTSYISDLLHGELGPSFRYPGRTVNELIAAGFPITAELALYAMIFAIFFGISSGVYAGLRPNSAHDYIPMSISMIGICIPSFLMGPIMVLFFGIYLGWLPISGWDNTPGDKILPTVTLGLGYAAFVSRLSRGGILEIMTRDYIRTARAKGLPSGIVVIKHALRGGLIPVVAFLGPAFAGLLSGSFIVETIFQIPGLGRFYIQAAFNRDYTMILGTTIFFATLIIIFNLLSDILVVWLNPKLRDKYRLNK